MLILKWLTIDVWLNLNRPEESATRVGRAQGESGERMDPSGRSCADDAVDTAKVHGVPEHGICQRQ